MSGLAGSTHKASAGKPSVTRLIHKICIAIKGKGNPISTLIKIISISAKLVESR